jgi:hypothetical protein
MRRVQTFRRGRLVTLIGRSRLLSSSRVSHGGVGGAASTWLTPVYAARDAEARSHILIFSAVCLR